MATTLKDRKEKFVTGLTGGSTVEIYTVTLVSLVSYFAYLFLYNRLKHDRENKFIIKILDFFLNWVILLISVTIYSFDTKQLVTFLVIPLGLIILYEILSLKKKSTNVKKITKVKLPLNASHLIIHKSFLTVYRAQMMVITMIAILAVDFKIFPRRFAKVETWGTSLMDLGVGSFVFSYGLFSSKSVILNKFNGEKFKFGSMLLKSIKDSIPLLVLGFIRFVSVKMVGYQEHVTEYGYHWNFFFTLGFLPIFVTLCLSITYLIPQIILSLVIALIYEIVLIKYDLLRFILIAPRVDLLSLNREGIFSFIGYLSIFLAGQGCGFFLLPGLKTPKNIIRPSSHFEIAKSIDKPTRSKLSVTPIRGLLYLSIFYQSLYYIINTCYNYNVSRRLANLLYVLWVCGYNTTFLSLFYMISTIYNNKVSIEYTKNEKAITGKDSIKQEYLESTPLSLEALNRNGLILFLISNLLTGLVNMTFNTLDADRNTSLLMLIGYVTVLAMISILMYNYKIFIKL